MDDDPRIAYCKVLYRFDSIIGCFTANKMVGYIVFGCSILPVGASTYTLEVDKRFYHQ